MLKLKHFKSSVMTAIRRDANIIYLLLKSVLTASYFLKNIATKKNGAYLLLGLNLDSSANMNYLNQLLCLTIGAWSIEEQ